MYSSTVCNVDYYLYCFMENVEIVECINTFMLTECLKILDGKVTNASSSTRPATTQETSESGVYNCISLLYVSVATANFSANDAFSVNKPNFKSK